MKRASGTTVANSRVAGPVRACVALLAAMLMLVASPVQAASASRVDKCNWDRPGVNPFMGDVVAAVDRYRDIPPLARARLKERMADRDFDEFVSIGRDAIKGQNNYDAAISDMHFGASTLCASVSRAGWSAAARQGGLVYCEGDHCILVPTVCRNVSRIRRLGTGAASGGRATAAAPGSARWLTPASELAPHGSGAQAGSVFSDHGPATVPGLIGYRDEIAPTPIGNGGFGPPFREGPGKGIDLTPLPVPEPAQWLMMGAGLLALAVAGNTKKPWA
jgi:hypothetical protein